MPFYEGIGLIAEKNAVVLDIGNDQNWYLQALKLRLYNVQSFIDEVSYCCLYTAWVLAPEDPPSNPSSFREQLNWISSIILGSAYTKVGYAGEPHPRSIIKTPAEIYSTEDEELLYEVRKYVKLN